MRQRILERTLLGAGGIGSRGKAKSREFGRKVRQFGRLAGAPTGGGGRRRAALSEVLSELGAGGNAPREVRQRAFREAHRRARQASEDEAQRWEDVGEAATASHAAGAAAFGARKRSCPVEPDMPPVLKSLRREATAAMPDEDAPAAIVPVGPCLGLALQEESWRSWQAVVAQDIAAQEAEKQAQEIQEQKLHDWVATNTPYAGEQLEAHGLSEVARCGTFAALPIADRSFQVQWTEWIPPGSEMAALALRGNHRKLARQMNLRKHLVRAWQHVCKGIRHADCPPVTAAPETASACFGAGFCICRDDVGAICRNMAEVLRRTLAPRRVRGWLRKKMPLRPVFQQGRLVLRFYRADAISASDQWLMLGYGNLNTLSFSCMVPSLSHAERPTRTQALLELPRGSRPCSLWQAMHTLAGTAGEEVICTEAWNLSASAERVPTFAPGRYVHIERCQPVAQSELWNPDGPAAPPGWRLRPFLGGARPLESHHIQAFWHRMCIARRGHARHGKCGTCSAERIAPVTISTHEACSPPLLPILVWQCLSLLCMLCCLGSGSAQFPIRMSMHVKASRSSSTFCSTIGAAAS